MTNNDKSDFNLEVMQKAGGHFGYSKSRRHPSTAKFILGTKNKTDYIDLEKTKLELERAIELIKGLAKEGKKILFVGSKPEAKKAVEEAAQSLNMPYVSERWIGGTLTNFGEIKKRIDRLVDLKDKRTKGELEKYTKKERLMIDREIGRLEKYFSGLVNLTKMPDLLIIVDSRKEDSALDEAAQMKIPVVSLCNTDCDIRKIDYPIIANDTAQLSIKFFIGELAKAYTA